MKGAIVLISAFPLISLHFETSLKHLFFYINSNSIGNYRDYNFLESSKWSYDPKPSPALQEKPNSLFDVV